MNLRAAVAVKLFRGKCSLRIVLCSGRDVPLSNLLAPVWFPAKEPVRRGISTAGIHYRKRRLYER